MVRVWIAATVALMLVPVTGAEPTEPGIYNPWESTPTTLYFHLSGLQDAMINTQKPSDRYAEAPGYGAITHSMCVNDPTGNTHLTDGDYHTYYARATPSIVQYDVDQGGRPRVHPEHGISFDVQLDTSVPFMFKWFLEAKMIPTYDGTGQEAGAFIPNVVVRATMREGDDISVGNTALNTGAVIAQGQIPPTHLLGSATDSDFVTFHDLGEKSLYAFDFPLEFERDVIRAEEAFNVRVDVFIENPACASPEAEESIMLDWIRVHTSPEFRPRMDLNVFNPLVITALHPQFIGDQLVVHSGANSPWGNYDVMGDNDIDPAPMVLEITGPSKALSVQQVALVPHYGGHGHHTEAVSATWTWDYLTDAAEDGIYTVTLRIQNDQETAEAIGVATFEIGGGSGTVCAKNHDDRAVQCVTTTKTPVGKKSPVPVALALLALVAVARRR